MSYRFKFKWLKTGGIQPKSSRFKQKKKIVKINDVDNFEEKTKNDDQNNYQSEEQEKNKSDHENKQGRFEYFGRYNRGNDYDNKDDINHACDDEDYGEHPCDDVQKFKEFSLNFLKAFARLLNFCVTLLTNLETSAPLRKAFVTERTVDITLDMIFFILFNAPKPKVANDIA